MLLTIKNLNISVLEKEIINSFNLKAKTGEIIALMGPNGSGKSTLLKSLLSHYSTKKNGGSILLNNINLTNKSTTEIAEYGIFYANQNPVDLHGVRSLDFLKSIIKKTDSNSSFTNVFESIRSSLTRLELSDEVLQQPVNHHLSGGQKKKFEMVQANLFKPNVLLLDEIDSGLDIDAMKLIAKNIIDNKNKMIIIVVSHHINFLKMLNPNRVLILSSGKIVYDGKTKILNDIKNKGFARFMQTYKSSPDFISQDPYRVCQYKKSTK